MILAYTLCAIYAARGEMRLDELAHFTQTYRFLHGEFLPLIDVLTTVPGYHLLLAGLMRLVDVDSFGAARLLSSLFGLLAVVGFHRLRKDAVGHEDFLATAQFAVLPVFLLFAFMVQTDALSLGLMLWATWAAGRQRHWLAGTFLMAAMCIRQNNVLWAALLAGPVIIDAWQQRARVKPVEVVQALLPYLLAGCVFVIYWIANGSVAVSHAVTNIHPDLSLHSGNLFCMLVIAALLFVFPCLEAWSRFIADVRVTPWLIVVPLGLAVLYLLTFAVDNPYNLLQPPDLRNWVLMRTRESALWYCGFGTVAVFGGVGLLWQRLLLDKARLLWPLSALFVSLSWLIEQRYYLISYALFMAWRTPLSVTIERMTLALWSILAVLFFWGMMSGQLYI